MNKNSKSFGSVKKIKDFVDACFHYEKFVSGFLLHNFSSVLKIFFIFLWVWIFVFSDLMRISNFPSLVMKTYAAVPTVVGVGTSDSSHKEITPALPSGLQVNDVLLLFLETANESITISNQNGGSWSPVTNSPQGTGTAGGTGATMLTVFWSRYNGSQGAPTTSDSGDHQIGVIVAFRGVATTGNPWDITSGSVDATGPTTLSIGGATTNSLNTLVVVATADDWDNASTTRYASWTNSNLSNIQERFDYGDTTLNGGGLGIMTGERASAGNYGTTTVSQNASILVNGYMTIALRPEPVTLATGTDPSNSTVAPNSSGNYLDQFTFTGSTDSVTALTITTANTTAIASMQIWDNSLTTQYFTTVSSPSGNNWIFSGGTAIPITSSVVSYRVIFTAKNHGDLTEGNTYAVTGYVSAFTSSNSQTGSDTVGTTITVDNAAPSNATWGTITPGDSQVELNWTNPSSDFYRVLILRKSGSSISDAPTEGQSYSVSDAIGSSTVVYVNNGTTFTDTGLTNSTDYYYRIFAYDSYLNYASGSGTGPHTPNPTPVVSVVLTTDGTVAYGTMDNNDTRSTIASDLNDMQTIRNDGNVTETFNIRGQNSVNWTLASSAGADQYVHRFCNDTDNDCSTPPTNYTALTTNYQTLDTGIGVSGTVDFQLQINTPNPSSVGTQQSVNIKIQAVQ